MNHFLTNSDNKPHLDAFRFHHRIDDDVFVHKKIDNNLFELMIAKNYKMATSNLWNSYKPNNRDTRYYLFDLYKKYIFSKNINPANLQLQEAIKLNNELLFHKLYWSTGHFNLYDQKYLRDDKRWHNWIEEVNKFGGIFKYRWGDLEIIGLYYYTYFEDPKLNLNFANSGHITDYSKGAKVVTDSNIFDYYIKKIYRKIRYQLLANDDFKEL